MADMHFSCFFIETKSFFVKLVLYPESNNNNHTIVQNLFCYLYLCAICKTIRHRKVLDRKH